MEKWRKNKNKNFIPGITSSDALPEEEGDDMFCCHKSMIVTDTNIILAVVI